MLTGLLIRIE